MSTGTKIIKITPNSSEKSLLEIEMSRRGMTQYSVYIKNILFEKEPQNKLEKPSIDKQKKEFVEQAKLLSFFLRYYLYRHIEDEEFVREYAGERIAEWKDKTYDLFSKNNKLVYEIKDLVLHLETIAGINIKYVPLKESDYKFPNRETYYAGTKEDKQKEYQKARTSKSIPVRLNKQEIQLLTERMTKEDWENTNRFLRYKVFGMDPEEKLNSEIISYNRDAVIIIFKNIMEEANVALRYAKYCYYEDMHFLQMTGPQEFDGMVKTQRVWETRFGKALSEIKNKSKHIIDSYEIRLIGRKRITTDDIDFTDEEALNRMAEELKEEVLEQHGWDITKN